MSNMEVEKGSLQRTLKDLFAGAAGGIAQVLLGKQRACRLKHLPVYIWGKLVLPLCDSPTFNSIGEQKSILQGIVGKLDFHVLNSVNLSRLD